MKTTTLFILYCLFVFKIQAGEKDLYDFNWLDQDKKVYVLQNKLYPKMNSFYFDVGYLRSLSGEFQTTQGYQLKLGYFFHEEWGIEAEYLSYSNKNNSAYKNVEIINKSEPFVRRPLDSTRINVIWSPFYGKINTFNQIFYFDWYLGGGIGTISTENNLKTVKKSTVKTEYEKERLGSINLKTGIKFYIKERYHFGVEFINTNYEANSPENEKNKKLEKTNDLTFSFGVSF